MKSQKTNRAIFLSAILICMAALLTSCGGGGGGSAGTSGGSAPASGSVAVLLADGPLDDLATLTLTITKISLLPSGKGNEVMIFDNPAGHPVDILQCRNQDYLFTLKQDVPTGRYEKIRLEVADITATGQKGTCAEMEIKLPSGKIDLNPRGGFEVIEGETLSIRLDVDARKSIQLHQAGNSGKCIFRPVIFVDIVPVHLAERCPAVFKGKVLSFLYAEDSVTVNGFVLDLPGERGSVKVVVDSEATVIFNKNADVGDIHDIQVGDTVYVRGPLTATGSLQASLVIVGEVLKLEGTVGTAVSTTPPKKFRLDLDDGQEFTDPSVDVELSVDTLILAGCNNKVDESFIQIGSQATVLGKYSTADNALKAMVIILKSREITGTLVSITPVEGNGHDLEVETSPGNVKTVILPQGEDVFLEGDGTVDLTLLGQLVACGKNPTVRVFLDQSIAAPLTAEKVFVIANELSGEVSAVDNPKSQLTLTSGAVVEIQAGATILKDSKPISLSQVKPKETVTVFGLTACDTDQVDFFGYILVVEQ